MQKERQKIQEENLRLQEELNNAIKIQEKLKYQAAFINKYQAGLQHKQPNNIHPALLSNLSPPPASYVLPPLTQTSLQPSTTQMRPPLSVSPYASLPVSYQNTQQIKSELSHQKVQQITNSLTPQVLDPRRDITTNVAAVGQIVNAVPKGEPSNAAQLAYGKNFVYFLLTNKYFIEIRYLILMQITFCP